ncbi:MAG TPA: hypothetical protein VIH88_15250 [Candidatus Acidoferrales bacterium]
MTKDQLKSYADERLIAGCIYCGGNTESWDHVPSRVLLDEPCPENLPVVLACDACNRGYSLDEQYFACLVECARTGSVETAQRPKIVRRFGGKIPLSLKEFPRRDPSAEKKTFHSPSNWRERKA